MERTTTYMVSNQFGKWLFSRSGAIQLLAQAKNLDPKANTLEIDFTGVSFISRSFADQLLKCIDRTRTETNKEITLVNPTRNIIELLKATRKTYKSQRQALPINYPHYTAKSKKEYFELLDID
ncbi:MAG TPA: hypothetical protein VFI14_10530 [Chryseosolibacter sp.]|nr:hypothetical protein [Chryseosolibacter sp.]